MDRIMPGIIALLFGAVAAIALLVPFVAVSYRRRGGLTASRTLGWLALLLWILGLQAYTLLPVPSGPYSCVGAELDPRVAFQLGGAGGLAQLLLNVALFVPWGVLLRLLWRRGIVVAGLTGLGISLLVETTQLTGVWGIFPCAYRVFDTADLLTNTAGALLGSLLALPFVHGRATPIPAHVTEITVARRLVGMVCDVAAVLCTTLVVGLVVNAVELYLLGVGRSELDGRLTGTIATVVVFALSGALVLASGSTLGELAVRLQGVDGRHPVLLWRSVRFLAGIGGFQLLTLLPAVGGLLGFVFVGATVVVAWRSEQHRGLALIVSGMTLRLVGSAAGRDAQVASQSAR